MLWISTLSYLVDESIGEFMDNAPASLMKGIVSVEQDITAKSHMIRKEQQWTHSFHAKEFAKQQSAIMEPIAKMKRQHEESADGLVILKATYSAVSTSFPASNKSLDATHQLQFWVNQSRLSLPASPKSLLMGFHDLIERKGRIEDTKLSGMLHSIVDLMNGWLLWIGIGEEGTIQDQCIEASKEGEATLTLKVRYKYQGQTYEIEVDDEEALHIPSRNAFVLGGDCVT
jgi:hypothetical protein